MHDDKTLTTPPFTPSTGPLSPGMCIGGRFTIEALAGRGGMGSVYRATDARTGARVALKLLHAVTSPEAACRFKREALLLSELSHPAIVSHVDDGATDEGQLYLAMEWLEGEDLAHRLARRPLELSETLALLRRVAEALATAHQLGVVHRDIKPSNLFLRGGHPEDVVVLDFGLARRVAASVERVTASDMLLGTPGYMAPEQASSQHDITSSADIFSLGCVLYECLTGKPPFAAPHFAAVLAKILFTEPAPLHTLHAGLPAGLQMLMDQLLAKDVRRRLPDAASVLVALSALEAIPDSLLPRTLEEAHPLGLAGAEQHLVSVLLVSLPETGTRESDTAQARKLVLRDSLRGVLAPFGAQVELLAEGSLVATLLPERGTATDQAALAARCALSLKEQAPDSVVVLATGRGILDQRLPIGEAMDRAGRLLHQLERTSAPSLVVLDEISAGLLGPGFQLDRDPSGFFLLQGERLQVDESRPLLGRPTPCVGREQELALLDFAFNACVEEPRAGAVLVLAPPGVGKSRLRHEFLRHLERKQPRPLVLLGRGDPMSTGAAYGLLGQALRRLCGIVQGEPQESHRERLSRRVARYLPEEQARQAAEFLGELCAIPFPEDSSPRLRAARSDPRLMSAQVGQALVAFLRAECARSPVLLVLEDLHWSDALTVALVDEVLRELSEYPFLVLALGRPEVKALFPGLWSRRLQELSLHGLTRKAGARLVRESLGTQVSDSTVQRIVEQSDGNALFLEELIRMVAEGRGEAPPETVLAMLQVRLGRMEAGVRQVLLAASIFGRTFWADGVREVLGREETGDPLERHLQRLVEQEIIEQQPDSRFSSVVEYRFRHALVRDAAYGLVPERHRSVSHRLVGQWLECRGELDPLVLATHYQLGGRLERAVHLHTRAAEQLFERHDLPGTLRCVEAALACGVSGEPLTRLRALQAVVTLWLAQFGRALELGTPLLAELKAGSQVWCRLLGGMSFGSAHAGAHGQAVTWSELLLHTTPEPEASTAYIESVTFLGVAFLRSGSRRMGEGSLERILVVGAEVLTHDAMARGWMRLLKSYFLYLFEASPWQAFRVAELGMRDFRQMGSESNERMLQSFAGAALAALGDVPGALAMLREALAIGLRTGLHLVVSNASQSLLQLLAGSSVPEHRREARALILEWIKEEDLPTTKQGIAHAMLARVLGADGELREAEAYARGACELLEPFQSYLVYAREVLGRVLLAQGRAGEARQVAALGVQGLKHMGSEGVFAVAMHLLLAEACFAEGEGSGGEAALREALRCVKARASDIPGSADRERFLRQVPENARTLELARQHWGESAA